MSNRHKIILILPGDTLTDVHYNKLKNNLQMGGYWPLTIEEGCDQRVFFGRDKSPQKLTEKNRKKLLNYYLEDINRTEENVFFQFYLLCMGFMYFLLPLHLFLFSTVQFTVYGYLVDRVHKEIHILGSPLEKYSWFMTLRKNHIRHHIHSNERFSILYRR